MHESESAELLREDMGEGVTRLTLNRPGARNALSAALLDRLGEALEYIAADDAAHVVIIRGAGPAFCAGHDLREMQALADEAARHALFARCGAVMQAVRGLPQPVIAQVHGVATAAGCQLVATCDLAVAADDARFATPGVNIGLFCTTPSVALSRTVAGKHAMEMLLTGELIDADTAWRFGLVNQLVPAGELEAATLELARRVASKSRHVVALGKAAYYRQAELDEGAAYEYASGVMADNLAAADAAEGIAAFLGKRHPEWRNA